MNAAYQNLQQGNLFQGKLRRFHLTQSGLMMMMLMSILLCSAIGIIYVKNFERQLFSEIQHIHVRSDKLEVEWGQLLLEQSTLSTPVRVQTIAESRFRMKMPEPSQIMMVRL